MAFSPNAEADQPEKSEPKSAPKLQNEYAGYPYPEVPVPPTMLDRLKASIERARAEKERERAKSAPAPAPETAATEADDHAESPRDRPMPGPRKPYLPICREIARSLLDDPEGAQRWVEKAAAIEPPLKALAVSSEKMNATLATLREEVAKVAAESTSAADRLAAARRRLHSARNEGEQVRLTSRLLADLDAARHLLDGGESALGRGVVALEKAQTTLCTDGETTSDTVFAQLVETTDAAAAALEREWRAWLSSGFDTLWQGARALALAPPGGLASGLDGLDGTRATLELARAHLQSATRVDGLLDKLRASGATAAAPSVAAAKRGGWPLSLHEMLRTACVSKCTSNLQVACRLFAQASAEPEVFLEALAEAAAASAKAARAVASLYSMLPPPTPAEPPVPVSDATDAAAPPPSPPPEAAIANEMAAESDKLLGQIKELPPISDGSGRKKALRALGEDVSALLKRQLDAAPTLVAAAHSVRGRRGLSVLGEANERLSSASLSHLRAEREAKALM